MKIIDKTKRPDIVEFCELEHGACFKIDDSRFDTDDVLMQSAYDSLSSQYAETDCDELTKIYLSLCLIYVFPLQANK